MINEIVKFRWRTRPRLHHSRIPWGYCSEDKTSKVLTPLPEDLDALEFAKELLMRGRSTRECCGWLLKETGQKLSHTGLLRRIEADNKLFLIWSEQPLLKEEYVVAQGEYGDKEIHEPVPRTELRSKTAEKRRRSKIKRAGTLEEKKALELNYKMRNGKTLYTRNKNKLKALSKSLDEDHPVQDLVPEEVKLEDVLVETQKEVVFKPNKGPQTDFLAAVEDEVFYGGARGGGKTYSLLVDPLRYCGNKNFRGLLLRRTTQELRDIVHEMKKLYPLAWPGAKYRKQENTWHFPSGARVELGYAENVDDAERYRGQSYTWIGIDELPQFVDEGVYNLLKSSLRSTDPTLPTYMRSTGNPGNIGSAWVKEKFIDPAPSNTRFKEEFELIDPLTGEKRSISRTMRYIPAKVWDNPYLTFNDSYIASLASLPEAQRKQMLEGNWDVIENGAFPEFNRAMHVIEPFPIPGNWLKFRSADWGYSSPFCCLWFAADWDNNLYVYKEYYGQGVYDDVWAETVADEELSSGDYVDYGILDGSTDSTRGERGETIYETINRVMRRKGVATFKKADRSPGSRIAGKQAVHRRLALKETGKRDEEGVPIQAPSLLIFNNCVNLIRTLPQLSLDKNEPEKVSKKQEDHAFDALHYGLRSRPAPAHQRAVKFKSGRHRVLDSTFGY